MPDKYVTWEGYMDIHEAWDDLTPASKTAFLRDRIVSDPVKRLELIVALRNAGYTVEAK